MHLQPTQVIFHCPCHFGLEYAFQEGSVTGEFHFGF